MTRFCIHFVIVAIIAFFVGFIAQKVDQARPDKELQTFLYLAESNQVKSFAFGFETAYADALWMLSIQAFHNHIIEKIPFREAKQVYKSIARLDPHFEGMYETACIYVGMIEKKLQPALDLLEESLHQKKSIGVKYPDQEQLINQPWMWFLLGRMYALQRHELLKKDDVPIATTMQNAIRCINQCLKLSKGKHPGALFFARFFVDQDRGFTFDAITWLQLYEQAKGNELLQKMILDKMRLLIASIQVSEIQNKVNAFKTQNGHWPENLKELGSSTEPLMEDMPKIARKLLSIISQTMQRSRNINKVKENLYEYINHTLSLEFPSSFSYLLHKGKVKSTIQLDKECERLRITLDILIHRFKKNKGHFPKNLEDLISSGYISQITLPLGRKFVYDSTTGNIDWK